MSFRKKARQEGTRGWTPTQLASYSRPEVPGWQGKLALETHLLGGALEMRCGGKTFWLLMLIQKPLGRASSSRKKPRKDEQHPGHFIRSTVTSSEKVSPSSRI